MLLLCLILTLFDVGSSYTLKEECYGGTFDFPFSVTPPLYTGRIFYTPKGGEQRIVVNNGESMDPRFKVSIGSIKIQDLTEQDHGAILFFGQYDTIKLNINDCAEPETGFYGLSFSLRVPKGAEYLEFSQTPPLADPLQPVVLWNRTDPSSGRGSVKRNYFVMYDLKQKDSGYYRLRGSNNQLLTWKKLIVQEYTQNIEHNEGENLFVDYTVTFMASQVVFTPLGSQKKRTLREADMHGRLEITSDYFSIADVTLEDAGTYELIDNQGNLVWRVKLEVMRNGPVNSPAWVYVVFLVGIVFGVILCCCCVKKCCCKKSSNKRNSPDPQTEAAAPAVYYHDATQPTHSPAPTYSYQPVNTPAPREPTITSPELPTFNSVMADMSPLPPTQVTAPGGYGPTSFTSTTYDFTSSDSVPKFDLKGLTFSSAPPLSSDISISHVYTSDKLNFL